MRQGAFWEYLNPSSQTLKLPFILVAVPTLACQRLSSGAYSPQVTSSGHDLFKQEKQEHDGSQGMVVQAVHCTTPWGTIYKVIINLYIYSNNFPESSKVSETMKTPSSFIKVLYALAARVTGCATLKLEEETDKGVKILNLGIIQHWGPRMFWISTAVLCSSSCQRYSALWFTKLNRPCPLI